MPIFFPLEQFLITKLGKIKMLTSHNIRFHHDGYISENIAEKYLK